MKSPNLSHEFLASTIAVLLFACSAEPSADPGTGGSPATGGSGAGQPATGGSTSAGTAGQGGTTGTGGTAGGGATSGGSAGTNAGGGGGAGGSGGGSGSSSGGASGIGGMVAGTGGAQGGGIGGNAGSGGTPGGGGASGAGGGTATGSMGCGQNTTQMLNQWVQSTPAGSDRPYSVYLPTGYDEARPYPVIVLLHGCSSGTNNLPMERQTGTDAILIRGTGSASGTCWDANATGSDVEFFDAMVADVKARFCTDTSRFFAVGYSSGSWLANQLGCIRADVLRGLGTVAGGNPGVRNCVGPIAHMFVHDRNDNDNQISGSISARDRLLTQNGCDSTTMPQEPSPCVRYQGCDPGYPVVWCETTGQGHNRQDNLAAPAFWDFFQEF